MLHIKGRTTLTEVGKTFDWYHRPNCIVLIRFLCNITTPPTPTHIFTYHSLRCELCFFLFLHFCWTVKPHPVFACSWTQVLSTIDLSQLIDSYTVLLLCHCYVIVLRCFCPDPRITTPGFVRRVYTTSYPVITRRKSGFAATERGRNRDSHRNITHTHR